MNGAAIVLFAQLLVVSPDPSASSTSPSKSAQAPASAPASTPKSEPTRARVLLVKIGTFPDTLLDSIEKGLRSELQVDVVRREGIALPKEAYYPKRKRYRADELLKTLTALAEGEPEGTKVLGMTSVDISTTKGDVEDWGIFGLGDLSGTACVLSTFRLRGHLRNKAHFRFRVVSVAVHEVGHTLGLDHCTEPKCVMLDAEGTIRTVDESTGSLGLGCKLKLDQLAPLRSPDSPTTPTTPTPSPTPSPTSAPSTPP
jgi:archaemetzincin